MAADINTSISELKTSLDASTAAIASMTTAFNSGILSLVNGLGSIDCSVCPPTGTYPPTAGIDEEDPPPAGFDDYDPAIDDRKCKLANMYFDDIQEVTTLLEANGINDIGALALGSMTALLGLVLGIIATGPVGWGLGALGAIAGVISFFLLASIDLEDLLLILIAEQQDLVLALYNSSTPEGAVAAFKAILSGGGANAAQLAYFDAVNMVVALEVLFFKPDGAYGDDIEARLDGYEGDIDCVGILCPWQFHLNRGTGDLTANDLERTLSSVAIAEGYTIQIRLPLPEEPGGCSPINRTYEIVSVSNWTNWPTSSNDSFCGDGIGGLIELWDNASDGAPPPGGEWTGNIFRISSLTTFTAQVILKSGSSGPCS